MSEVKKVPRKLRGRETILVDAQILRRRKMLAREDIVLGRASRQAKRARETRRKERAKPEPAKRKWF